LRAQTLGCRADSAHQSAAWAHAGAWHCAAGATQARAVFAGDIGGRAHRSWTALRRLIEDVREEWRSIDQRIKGYNDELAERVHNEEAAKRLTRIPGIGVLTATALVAAVGNAQTFSCGRDLAAWLGLVPRQATTGGKPRLLRISKRGNGYLRVLLIHGARTALPGLAKIRRSAGGLRLCLREHIATSCPWQTSWRGLLGRSLHVIAGMWLFKLRPVE
jgi:transposase